MENRRAIISRNFVSHPQRGAGTYHSETDLPKAFSGWEAKIQSEITRLDNLIKAEAKNKLEIISEIENVRKANNVNWMEILRLALSQSPSEAKEIVKKSTRTITKFQICSSNLENNRERCMLLQYCVDNKQLFPRKYTLRFSYWHQEFIR